LKTRFIVNPRSGRSGRAARALPQVRAFAERRGAKVVLTERPRHARELAAAALDDGCERIVAVGGDGTMNEIASVLVGTPAVFGLIPCGSGDGLGRHLGIHGSVTHALALLDSGRARVIDTGVADGHPFFSVAGLGFEAEIADRFNQLTSRGFLRYIGTALGAFLRWQPQAYTVTHAAGREQIRAFTLAVANSDQYGNNARIAPGAHADDGLLDLCALPPANLFNAAPLAARLFSGSIGRARGVRSLSGAHFIVERASVGPLHTDGEVHTAGKVIEFSIRPASLRIMMPAP
jgi:YegS/Rv2252/BmrU family lipid kinase